MKDVVVAALDDVDGVDLHIAKLGDGRERSPGSLAEGLQPVEPLRRDPDVARAGLLKREWWLWQGFRRRAAAAGATSARG